MSDLSEYLEVLQNHLSLWGYAPIDTPMLEETELYLRKSGSEVITRLYSLTDPGGRQLSLRPEFTASVIKTYVKDYPSAPLPIRWQYSGPVFRYGSRYGPFGQSHQVGAELIGASSPLADAEVIAAACKGLEGFGINEYEVVVGHAGLLPSLLDELRLSQRSKNLILANIQSLQDSPEGVDRLKVLIGHSPGGQLDNLNGENVITDEGTLAVFRKLLSGGAAGYTGSRSVEEIMNRFSEKLTAERYEDLDKAISLVAELAVVQGDRVPALRAARSIIGRYGLRDTSLPTGRASSMDRLEGVLELLERAYALTSIKLDLGLVRGLAYYTGPIFEVRVDTSLGFEAVCGGGRYDGLVRALGGDDVPALGFAYYIENLKDVMETKSQILDLSVDGSTQNGFQDNDLVLIVPASKDYYSTAVAEAQRRRAGDQKVRVEVVERTVEDSLNYAAASGIKKVLVVGEAGVESEHLMTVNGWSLVVRFSN